MAQRRSQEYPLQEASVMIEAYMSVFRWRSSYHTDSYVNKLYQEYTDRLLSRLRLARAYLSKEQQQQEQ